MEEIKTDGVDIRSWCPNVDQNALEQMKTIASLPYVRECCLMPDAHLGQNCCIGGVVATENVVVPDFVGSDIGCGMCAIKTSLKEEDLTEGKSITLFNMLSQAIPVGFSHNTDKRRKFLSNRYSDKIDYIVDKTNIDEIVSTYNPVGDYRKEFASQLGTLGGG